MESNEIKTVKVYSGNGKLLMTRSDIATKHCFPGGCYLTTTAGGNVDISGGTVIIETPPQKKSKK